MSAEEEFKSAQEALASLRKTLEELKALRKEYEQSETQLDFLKAQLRIVQRKPIGQI